MGSVQDLYRHDHHDVDLPLHYLLDEGVRVFRWVLAPVVTVDTRPGPGGSPHSSGQGLRGDGEGEEGEEDQPEYQHSDLVSHGQLLRTEQVSDY